MNEFLTKVGEAFTPARRKFIYHTAFSATLIGTLHGWITAEEAEQYLLATSYLLFGGTFELAAANVDES